jgi:hypothetical protein
VELAIVGSPEAPGTQALLAVAWRHYLPKTVLAGFDPAAPDAGEVTTLVPLLCGKALVGGRPAAYVCRDGTCREPVTTPEGLEKALE